MYWLMEESKLEKKQLDTTLEGYAGISSCIHTH